MFVETSLFSVFDSLLNHVFEIRFGCMNLVPRAEDSDKKPGILLFAVQHGSEQFVIRQRSRFSDNRSSVRTDIRQVRFAHGDRFGAEHATAIEVGKDPRFQFFWHAAHIKKSDVRVNLPG